MILFIPVSHKDVDRLPLQTQLFGHFGGLENHQVHIMGERQVGRQCDLFAKEMRELCSKVVVSVLDFDPPGGWPQAPNTMWYEAVKLFAQYGRQPVYFYELDNYLLQRGGIDAIEHEYKLAGKPYMGAVVPTRKFRWEPAGVPREQQKKAYYEDGTHMVGTGVYAADVFGRLTIWKYCQKARDANNNPVAFDHYQADELKRNGLHATKLIQHRWSTQNYRMEGGQIVCDNIPDNPFGTDHSGPVDPKAVVLHGCKDESLARLVMEGPVRDAYQEDRLTLSVALTKQLRQTYGGDRQIIDLLKSLGNEAVLVNNAAPISPLQLRRNLETGGYSTDEIKYILSNVPQSEWDRFMGIKKPMQTSDLYPVPLPASAAISPPQEPLPAWITQKGPFPFPPTISRESSIPPEQSQPLASKGTDSTESGSLEAGTSSESEPEPPAGSLAPEGLLQRAISQLEPLGPKKCVLSQLASTLKVDKEELRTVINAEGSGWRVDDMGPGWIRRAQLQTV